MKKSLTSLAIFCIVLINAVSSLPQSTGINYSFIQVGSMMVFNNSASGIVTLIPGGADDALVTFTVPATWSGFYYGGNWFPQGSVISVSSNGWLSLSNPASSLPANSLASTPMIIAPLWD